MNVGKFEVALPVHFFSAGQFVSPPGWVHLPRCIETSVVILVEKGHFVIWEDEHRMEVGPHETVILRAGHKHRGEADPNDIPPVYYWAHFVSNELPGSEKIEIPLHASCENYAKATVYFHQLLSEWSSQLEYPLACDYLMTLILLEVSKQRDPQSAKVLCARIKEYLRLNFRNNITLEQLTQVFPYNTDYMSRVFKKNVGVSIRHYLHNLRLTEAKSMLLSTLDTVKQIANSCGYTNEKHFITTFVRYEGITPTQYRNMFGNLHQNIR